MYVVYVNLIRYRPALGHNVNTKICNSNESKLLFQAWIRPEEPVCNKTKIERNEKKKKMCKSFDSTFRSLRMRKTERWDDSRDLISLFFGEIQIMLFCLRFFVVLCGHWMHEYSVYSHECSSFEYRNKNKWIRNGYEELLTCMYDVRMVRVRLWSEPIKWNFFSTNIWIVFYSQRNSSITIVQLTDLHLLICGRCISVCVLYFNDLIDKQKYRKCIAFERC